MPSRQNAELRERVRETWKTLAARDGERPSINDLRKEANCSWVVANSVVAEERGTAGELPPRMPTLSPEDRTWLRDQRDATGIREVDILIEALTMWADARGLPRPPSAE